MKKKIISLILCLTLVLLIIPTSIVQAKTVYRYTTKTVKLRDKACGKQVFKVPRNTQVQLIKAGKSWARVKYKNRNVYVEKKFLHVENLPNAKKSKEYIKYLHTKGPVKWRGRKYTYYTSRLLPIWKLPVPGLHLDKNGFFCDNNDYIVLGSSRVNKANKVLIATPFGKYGKVYDTGGPNTPSWLCDCATNW